MISSDSQDRLVLLAIGLLVVLGPVMFLVATLGVLVMFGDLALGRITFVELLELYVIDLILFFVVGYGIYRLTLWLVVHQAPESLDSLESPDAEDSREDGSTTGKDP